MLRDDDTPEPIAEVLVARRVPLLRRLWVRVLLVFLALSITLFSIWYWPRRTMIAVWRINGMVFSDSADQQTLEWASFTTGGWAWNYSEEIYRLASSFQTDAAIHHVNLIDAEVDDRWLSRLNGFPNLEGVGLHDRQLGPGLDGLRNHTALTHVCIHSASANHLAELQRLPQIETLLIWKPGADVNLEPLSGLPNLTSILLSECRGTDELLRKLPELPRIDHFNFQDCQGLTDDGLANMRRLPNLEFSSYFKSGAIGDRGLAHLARLEKLDQLNIFKSTGQITDAGVDSLLECRGRFKELSIVPSSLTAEQTQRLRDGLPGTTVWVQ